MKKSKLFFAVLSATVVAASAGALVACGNEVELPDGTKVGGVREVTFSANGGVFGGESAAAIVKTDEFGHIATEPAAPELTGHTFTGYNFKQDGTGEKVTFGDNGTVFLLDVTVYAQWTKNTTPVDPGTDPTPGTDPEPETEYTITFHGGEHGTITGETTAKTVNGKIAAFPTVEVDTGWLQDGWMLLDETPIDTDVVFTADADVYVNYVADPVTSAPAAAIIGGVQKAMSRNESPDTVNFPTLKEEYVLEGVYLDANQTVTFELRNEDGELAALPGKLFIDSKSAGIDISVTSSPVTGMTALRAGTYKIYLKLWDTNDWSVYATDGGKPIVEEQTLTDGAFYLVGDMSDWQLKQKYELKDNTLEIDLEADKWFKVATCQLTQNAETGEDEYTILWGDYGTNQFAWYQLDTASQAHVILNDATGDSHGNVKVKTDGTYIVTVNKTSKTWSIALKGGEGPVDPVEPVDPPVDPVDPDPGDTKLDGLYVGDTRYPLTKNTGSTTRVEYWLGGSKIKLNKGDVITLWIGGEQIKAFVEGSSAGVDKSVIDEELFEFTVTVAGEFEIYLHQNANDWSCEFSGPTEVEVGSEIPAGAAKVEITFKGGQIVTIYLLDANGKAIGADDLSKYALYTYNGEICGNWAGSVNTSNANNGILKSAMDKSSYTVPEGWIFRWGSGYGTQTANIINAIQAGHAYIIQLPSANKGTPVITEVALTTNPDPNPNPEPTPEPTPEPDPNPDPDPTPDPEPNPGENEVDLSAYETAIAIQCADGKTVAIVLNFPSDYGTLSGDAKIYLNGTEYVMSKQTVTVDCSAADLDFYIKGVASAGGTKMFVVEESGAFKDGGVYVLTKKNDTGWDSAEGANRITTNIEKVA